MMTMSGRITGCCAALFLVLTSVSAVQRLNSINDLKKIKFGQSVPKHSLLLLHWFVDTVDLDNNDLIQLTFDPNSGDYGSHHYGNFERMLEQLPQGNTRYRYYTVGNLNRESSLDLPSYVVHPGPEYDGRNMDRIIFRVREQNLEWQDGQIIDRVYITQHYETTENLGTRYNPDLTYQVSNHLLRQIREFSMEANEWNSLTDLRDRYGSNANNSQLEHIRNTWGDLAGLGLLLFIVIAEKHSTKQHKKKPQPAARRNTKPDFVVNIPERGPSRVRMNFVSQAQNQTREIQLEVTTGKYGKAQILWRNVPRHFLHKGVMVVLYKNNEDEKAMTYKSIGNTESGSFETSVPLSEGLQVRLHEVRKLCLFWEGRGEEIFRGTEFKNPQAVNITGYDAKLQLFAKDGKACARLYVKRYFSDWRSAFSKSWVGFYNSANKTTNDYEWWKWQWATKFKPNTDFHDFYYDIYEYHSGMTIAPGVQARFILKDEEVKAHTPSWSE
ncbi:uncharacterized protein [Brachyistius frenatus]|uniref:uncharacterized protein n=1 Tax=Brachyistius frenatus TaxID=100188 RepID=UPI0037E72DF0